jgi:hypothetical protein
VFFWSYGFVYLSQKATFKKSHDANGDGKANGDEKDDEDKNNNEALNGVTVLECIGAVASRLVAKPSSLQFELLKRLAIAGSMGCSKSAGHRVVGLICDGSKFFVFSLEIGHLLLFLLVIWREKYDRIVLESSSALSRVPVSF